jgi:serine/threonine protein phosphatase PrpC
LLSEFERKIMGVNSDLRALALTRDATVMGTTLIALLVHGAHYACVWCGDSRAYLRRDGVLSQVSRDHSEVQELIDRGLLDEEEARVWPRRNVVTRALGATEQAELELVGGRAAESLRRPASSNARPRRDRQRLDHHRRLRSKRRRGRANSVITAPSSVR